MRQPWYAVSIPALIVAAVVLPFSACAQGASETVMKQVAERLASERLIELLVDSRRDAPLWPHLPFETRLGLGLARGADDELLRVRITYVRSMLAGGLQGLIENKEYIDALLKNASERNADAELRKALESIELLQSDLVTPMVASSSIRAERAVIATVGRELNLAMKSLTDALIQGFHRHPEFLTSFVEVHAPSEGIRRARQKLKTLIEETKKKTTP